MKNKLILFVLAIILFGACGPKPMYKTSDGKKKLKYYNKLQFGQHPTPPKR